MYNVQIMSKAKFTGDVGRSEYVCVDGQAEASADSDRTPNTKKSELTPVELYFQPGNVLGLGCANLNLNVVQLAVPQISNPLGCFGICQPPKKVI